MRNSWRTVTVVAAIAMFGTGCGAFSGKTFKKFDINKNTSISMDASQRAILVKTSTDDEGHDYQTVCAEPSPDAMIAASAGLAAKGASGTGATGEASAQFAQAATSIGIRTATIQLLRDGYFRACEATMNDLLDSDSYQVILLGITPIMVGLAAIDGLTQMPAANVFVTAGGSASTDEDATSAAGTVSGSAAPTTPTKPDLSGVADDVVKIVDMVLTNHTERLDKMMAAAKEKAKEK